MSIGVIGGADGPTAIYVASNPASFIFFAGVIVAAAVICFVAIRAIRKRKK